MRQRLAKSIKSREADGFTLIELLIVIVILGILAAIVVFAVGTATSDSKTSACKADKSNVETALEAAKAKTGSYPTGADSAAVQARLAQSDTTAANYIQGGPYLKKVPNSSDYTIAVTMSGTAPTGA